LLIFNFKYVQKVTKYRYQAIKQKEQSKLKRQDNHMKQGDTNDWSA